VKSRQRKHYDATARRLLLLRWRNSRLPHAQRAQFYCCAQKLLEIGAAYLESRISRQITKITRRAGTKQADSAAVRAGWE